MGNLALNRLPIEREIWTKPEETTNGNINEYDDHNGFGYAVWPCNYTIDLESEFRLSVIRFLLWDNLGKPGTNVNPRKYKFTLSVSSDGINYFTIFSNQNKDGGNGWFAFEFTNDFYARYIRLTGHFNSANKHFHLVEFEIHDQAPPPVVSKNYQSIDIAAGIGMPSEQRMTELINNVISTRSAIFEGVEEKLKMLDSSLKKSGEAFEQIDLIKKSNDFTTEAANNNKRAIKWLWASGITLLLFLVILIWFVFCDNHSTKIITDAAKDMNVQPYTTLLVSAFYATKAVLLSTILFILTWLLKNYRSEKHNYVINKHKAMTLTVATGILTKEDYKNTDRGNIFIQAMEIIFTHQVSGFSKEDTSSPNVIDSLLQKGIPKGDM
ncbi:MAG TPA: hypothetical protein P5228_01570 [Bacteroidales bacterium]|nr:hypothetical protein [Bacteroidales bacterium]HRZ48888.1 hypothetical protein [Bacteroidales bacterium]